MQDRTIRSSKEWRRQIQEVDAGTYRTLQHDIKGGFDEEKFGSRIGFGNLKGCAWILPIALTLVAQGL